jgi:lysophospholipase L1-like esterase
LSGPARSHAAGTGDEGGAVTRPAASLSPGRSRLFKLLALVISGLASLALAEGVLRVFPGLLTVEMRQILEADSRNYGVAHPYIGHLHKPNSTIVIPSRDFSAYHHTDGLGFRNAWPWPAQASVAVVGDSVTFGYGVADAEAWPAILAKSLVPDTVINLGLIGAGPQQYLRVYETFGVKLRPKLLIVGFLPTNDFWDADVFDQWLKSGAGGNYMAWRDFGRPQRPRLSLRDPLGSVGSLLSVPRSFLASHSRLYQMLLTSVHQVEGPRPVVRRFADGSQVQLQPGQLAERARNMQPDRAEFRLAVDAVDQLRTLATEQGTHVLVLLLPGKEEVYLPLTGADVPDTERHLRDALDRLRIEYLDLTPGFRQRAAAGERLFFEVDGHPNTAGYGLIAELVRAHLAQHARRYGLAE